MNETETKPTAPYFDPATVYAEIRAKTRAVEAIISPNNCGPHGKAHVLSDEELDVISELCAMADTLAAQCEEQDGKIYALESKLDPEPDYMWK